jgi:hypothetical protein
VLDVGRDFELTLAVVRKSKIEFCRSFGYTYQSFANPFLFFKLELRVNAVYFHSIFVFANSKANKARIVQWLRCIKCLGSNPTLANFYTDGLRLRFMTAIFIRSTDPGWRPNFLEYLYENAKFYTEPDDGLLRGSCIVPTSEFVEVFSGY